MVGTDTEFSATNTHILYSEQAKALDMINVYITAVSEQEIGASLFFLIGSHISISPHKC
jgi:hypothetical protein